MDEILVRFAHFIGIIVLASMLITENILVRKTLPQNTVQLLARVDGIYGVGAVITLIAGLLLWLAVGKPAPFYSGNPVFHFKLTIFVVVGIMSLVPTFFFAKHRKFEGVELIVPRHILIIKRIELVLLLMLPLLAVLMARGVGLG